MLAGRSAALLLGPLAALAGGCRPGRGGTWNSPAPPWELSHCFSQQLQSSLWLLPSRLAAGLSPGRFLTVSVSHQDLHWEAAGSLLSKPAVRSRARRGTGGSVALVSTEGAPVQPRCSQTSCWWHEAPSLRAPSLPWPGEPVCALLRSQEPADGSFLLQAAPSLPVPLVWVWVPAV